MSKQVRTFKTRDSATALMRKLGVQSKNYKLFLEQIDGQWVVDVSKIQGGATEEPTPPAPELTVTDAKAKKPRAKKVKAEKPAKEPKEKRVTVTQVAEQLILDGKTNDEVWAVIQPQFRLDDNKKNYPSWFRSRLKKHGRL